VRRSHQHRLQYLGAGIGLGAVFLFALRSFLVGELFPIWDAQALLAPYYMLISDFARAGKLLWWNPWSNGGQPDFVDPQYGAHSPVVLALAWLLGPSLRGFIAYWFAIWLCFGIGVIALAKQWRVPAWGGFVVGLGSTFSGFFLGHAEHTPIVFSWAWIPWVLWRLEVAVERRSWRAAAQAGVLFGLSALGGYPAVLLTNALFLSCWIAMRAFVREESAAPRAVWSARLVRAASLAAVLFSIAVVIAFPTFFNFFHEGRFFTNRVGSLPRSLALSSNALHPLALLTFASPFLANLSPEQLWTYTDESSSSCYAGGLVFIFAVFSLVARPRSHLRWLLLAGSALAVAASLGSELPVRGLLYDWVPFTRYFRHAALFRAYPIFLLGVLALWGIRDYLRASSPAHLRWRLAAVSVTALALAALAYRFLLKRASPIDHRSADIHFLFAWVGPTLVAIGALFDRAGKRRNLVVGALVALAATDAVLGAALPWTLGNRAKSCGPEWASVEAHHRSGLDLLRLDGANRIPAPVDVPDDRSFHARTAVLRSYSGLRGSLHDRWNGNATLVATATTADRFWFSSEPVWLRPCEDAFPTFVDRTNRLGAAPLVLHDRAAMMNTGPCASGDLRLLAQAPRATRIAVTLDRYLPDAMTLRLVAPRDGWLLVTDRWAPGWKARVNGEAAPVQGADFLYRGISVRAGSNRIELTYRPPGYPWAPVAIWLFVAVVLGWSCWPVRSDRLASTIWRRLGTEAGGGHR
jgi:hypothetical protein